MTFSFILYIIFGERVVLVKKELEKFKNDLAVITGGCAYIKLGDNEELKYVRIDDRKFTNMNKMAEQIIDYSRNIQKAIKIMRGYQFLKDLPDKIPDFVIKYHPSWITLRQQAGYLDKYMEDGETHCTYDTQVKTYQEWMTDNFVAIGEKEYYPKGLNPNAMMTRSVFDSVIRPEVESKEPIDMTEYFHHDTYAFVITTQWKNVIDNGNDEGVEMKNVRYKLDRESHFPLLVTGTNKGQRVYDFRKGPAVLGFTKYLSKRNPGNQYLNSEVNKLEKVIRGY